MPEPGSTAQLGAEYSGNGELCWVGEVTSTTGSCGTPSATNYETLNYNTSGDLTSTAAHTYGSNMGINWNVDASEPTCINPSGTSCTGPSSTQPNSQTSTYNADGLRMSTESWNGTSVNATSFTWETISSALLSNGTFDYIYGQSSNVPIAQLDTGDSATTELLTDPNSNFRALIEVTPSGGHPYTVANVTDYDAYGNPITSSGGSPSFGLTTEGDPGDPDSATSFGFGGGYTDTSGLVYFVHRFYDPILGSFLSPDPMLLVTGVPYVYADDDPVMESDHFGLASDPTDPGELDCPPEGNSDAGLLLAKYGYKNPQEGNWFQVWLECGQEGTDYNYGYRHLRPHIGQLQRAIDKIQNKYAWILHYQYFWLDIYGPCIRQTLAWPQTSGPNEKGNNWVATKKVRWGIPMPGTDPPKLICWQYEFKFTAIVGQSTGLLINAYGANRNIKVNTNPASNCEQEVPDSGEAS